MRARLDGSSEFHSSAGLRGSRAELLVDSDDSQTSRQIGTASRSYAPGRNRTYDLALRRRALYPLSYGRGGGISLARVELSARIVTLRLAETFTISRESQDEADVVQVEVAARRHERLRRGGADRALRRVGRVGARVPRGERRRARRRSVRARRDLRPAAARAVRRAQRDRRCAARPPGQAARAARAPAARPAARRAADVVDDLARRSRRHGAPRREDAARRALPPAEAQARRARRPRRRARPRRARRDRPAAAGRRERVLVARRGARVPARRWTSSTASSRCPPAIPTGRS